MHGLDPSIRLATPKWGRAHPYCAPAPYCAGGGVSSSGFQASAILVA